MWPHCGQYVVQLLIGAADAIRCVVGAQHGEVHRDTEEAPGFDPVGEMPAEFQTAVLRCVPDPACALEVVRVDFTSEHLFRGGRVNQ